MKQNYLFSTLAEQEYKTPNRGRKLLLDGTRKVSLLSGTDAQHQGSEYLTMADITLNEDSLIQSILQNKLPAYLINYWQEQKSSQLIEDTKKLKHFLKNGFLGYGVIGCFIGIFLILCFLVLSGQSLGKNMSTILFGGIFSGLFGFLLPDPQYRRRIIDFRRFINKHLTDLDLTFSELISMDEEEIRNRADVVLIALAVKIRQSEQCSEFLPEKYYIQEKNRLSAELNKLFDQFKKFGIVHLDEQGGYGWHYQQADNLLDQIRLAKP